MKGVVSCSTVNAWPTRFSHKISYFFLCPSQCKFIFYIILALIQHPCICRLFVRLASQLQSSRVAPIVSSQNSVQGSCIFFVLQIPSTSKQMISCKEFIPIPKTLISPSARESHQKIRFKGAHKSQQHPNAEHLQGFIYILSLNSPILLSPF